MVELVKRYYMISITTIIVIIFILFNILNADNDDIQLVTNSEKSEDINTNSQCSLPTNEPVQYPAIITDDLETHYKSQIYDTRQGLNNSKPLDSNEELSLNSKLIYNNMESSAQSNVINKIDEVSTIPVYICGEVKEPGVYEIKSDDLINDIVNLAGGFTKDADTRAINLASKVSSNEMIIVPKIGEQVTQTQIATNNIEDNITDPLPSIEVSDNDYNIPVNSESTLVNINTANKTLLMSLPGIGEVKADAIIEYRQSTGGFSNIADIKNVSGIGDKTFEKLTKLITI